MPWAVYRKSILGCEWPRCMGGEISRTSSGRYRSRGCRRVPGRGGRRLASPEADRRHTVPGPYRCSVAWCTCRIRAVGPGYDLFRRWQRNGTWHRIRNRLQSLADAKGAITWDLSVDSTVCRAHQHAAGAHKQGDLQKEPPVGVFTELPDHGLGGRAAGSPPNCAWPSSTVTSPCRSW